MILYYVETAAASRTIANTINHERKYYLVDYFDDIFNSHLIDREHVLKVEKLAIESFHSEEPYPISDSDPIKTVPELVNAPRIKTENFERSSINSSLSKTPDMQDVIKKCLNL